MNCINDNDNEPGKLAGILAGKYGRLALTRAAGEANAADLRGDKAKSAAWHGAIAHLRMSMVAAKPSEAV